MSQEISVSRIGRALHRRLDRAGKRNAVTRSMYQAMAETIAGAEVDETIRAVLFSGAGDAFGAANDLNDFASDPPTGTDRARRWHFYSPAQGSRVSGGSERIPRKKGSRLFALQLTD